jgi:hypothetical protein
LPVTCWCNSASNTKVEDRSTLEQVRDDGRWMLDT